MKDTTSFTMEFKIVGSQRDHEFGNMVREARLKKGLTQKQLGEFVDKSNAHISEIERHKKLCSSHSSRGELVAALAYELDLDTDKCFIAARCPEGIALLEDRLADSERKNGRLKKERKMWLATGFGLGMTLFIGLGALHAVLQ